MSKLILPAVCLFLLNSCRTNDNQPNINGNVGNRETPPSTFDGQDLATETAKSPVEESDRSQAPATPEKSVPAKSESSSQDGAEKSSDLIAATKAEDSKAKAEGSGVNNGTGPLEDRHSCKEVGGDGWTFNVRSTAAVGTYQGILDRGNGIYTTLYCPRNWDGTEDQRSILNCRSIQDDPSASFVINEMTLTAELKLGGIQKTFTCSEEAP